MLGRCCAQSNKPHFSAGLFNTRDSPAKASGSEMAHSLLTSGFLMRVLEDVEGGTLETSCLNTVLGYNSMIVLIGQEFGVEVNIWRLFVKTVIEFCSSLKGEHMCRLGLYPWTNARDPAVWVSLSLSFFASSNTQQEFVCGDALSPAALILCLRCT